MILAVGIDSLEKAHRRVRIERACVEALDAYDRIAAEITADPINLGHLWKVAEGIRTAAARVARGLEESKR